MRIRLRGRNSLFTFRNDKGNLSSINIADFSGRINFRQIVRDYLKEERIFVATRTVTSGSSQFLAFMKRSLTAFDVLRIALKLQRR